MTRANTQQAQQAPVAAAVWAPIASLKEWARNPRANDGAPVEKVAKSLRAFGFVAPICVWESTGRMVAGHTRLKALRSILAVEPDFVPKGAPGPGLVPVRFHEFTDEAEADAYAIADNRLAEEADWAKDALAEIVGELAAERMDLLDAAGLEHSEIEELLLVPGGGPDDVDEVPELPKSEPVTQLGDVWVLGRHRLICGDSTNGEVVARLMAGGQASLLWTDPPYNVAYVGKTKNALTIQNDSMADGVFREFLVAAFRAADGVMANGAVFYIAHADGEGFNFRGAVRDIGWKLAQCLIWVKDVFVMGRQDYHWRHEPILYGWKLGAGHHMLEDRTQDTVWECPRPKRSEEHPTMKPVELVERAVKNSTGAGEIVLDIFGGSGTTLVACERTGRTSRLVELDPRYCDVIVERWERMTGEKAHRLECVADAAAE